MVSFRSVGDSVFPVKQIAQVLIGAVLSFTGVLAVTALIHPMAEGF